MDLKPTKVEKHLRRVLPVKKLVNNKFLKFLLILSWHKYLTFTYVLDF